MKTKTINFDMITGNLLENFAGKGNFQIHSKNGEEKYLLEIKKIAKNDPEVAIPTTFSFEAEIASIKVREDLREKQEPIIKKGSLVKGLLLPHNNHGWIQEIEKSDWNHDKGIVKI